MEKYIQRTSCCFIYIALNKLLSHELLFPYDVAVIIPYVFKQIDTPYFMSHYGQLLD